MKKYGVQKSISVFQIKDELLEKHNLTLREFARKYKIRPETVSRALRDPDTYPNVIKILTQVLGREPFASIG